MFYRVKGCTDEHRGPGVAAVVKELSERTARSSSSSLFPIDPYRNEKKCIT